MNNDEERDIEIVEDSPNPDDFETIEDENKNKQKVSNIDVQKKEGEKYSTFEKCRDYIDFELEINCGIGREYPVSLIHSPAGEVHETMQFPFDDMALDNALKDIQIAILQSGGNAKRQFLSQEEQTVKDFGQKLFETLIKGELRGCFNVSLHDAAKQGKGLRLKLRINPPELAALPWEFLYDPQQGDYVTLSSNTPIVRYLELPQSIKPLSVDPPLRILGMIVSPHDLPSLDVAIEKQRVEEAIKDLREQGLVDITWLHGQTWEDLQQVMRTGIWHIFHFIGHGGFDRNTDEGIIALADAEGKSFLLTATQLGRFLAGHIELRMVLLNSCEGARGGKSDIFSSTASILVRRGIPAVLAMQYKITDKAAIEFAKAFYLALSDGMPVDAAVSEARIAVSVAVTNTIEWGTPVLYMRSPDGVLFKIEKNHPHFRQQEKIHKLRLSARKLYDSGKYAEAFDKWNDVLDIDPGNEMANEGKKEADDKIKKFCPKCGTKNTRRKEFCRFDGVRLYRTA